MSLNQLKLQATDAADITPADGSDLPTPEALIYIGVGGDVKVSPSDPDCACAIVFKNCIAGTVLPVKVNKVYSTGTTATNLVALY